MQAGHSSISRGGAGTDYPITSVTGYAADNRSLILQIALQPGHEYEFVCTGRGFHSADGYTLPTYKVHFKTRI